MFKMSAFSVYDKGVSVRGVQWSTRTELSDLKVSSGSQDSPSQHVYSCLEVWGRQLDFRVGETPSISS